MGFVIIDHIAEGDLWNPREVPFLINTADFPPGSFGREQVELAIEKWNATVPHIPLVDKEPHHLDFAVFVQDPKICMSDIGRQRGRQDIRCNLGSGLAAFGNVMHEIGHAIGLAHEHLRPDRDKFIRIICENIPDKDKGLYDLSDDCTFEPNPEFEPVGVYDYDSIMHYPLDLPPRFDLLRIDEQPGAVVGQRDHLSERDIQATLFLYGFRAPRTVSFGLTGVGDVKTQNVSIVNHLPRSIAITTGPLSSPFFKVVKKFPDVAGPFRKVSATVEFRPPAPGKVQAKWTLTIADVPVTVRVSGRASMDIDPE